MTDPEIIEYEGRRFVRTGEVRKPKSGEFYMSPSSGNPHMARMDFRSCARELLRELPAETPRPLGPLHVYEGGNFVKIGQSGYTEYVIRENYLGGPLCVAEMNKCATEDHHVDMDTAKAWAAEIVSAVNNRGLLAEAEEALARLIEDLPIKRDWLDPTLESRAKSVLARIQAAKEEKP